MENYKKYEEFSNELRCAKNWIANKDKIDSQSHSNYSLYNIVFSADYCGQAYAGANNYHASPKVLNEYMAKAIKINFSQLTEQAILLMQDKANALLIASEQELETIQNAIKAAKEAV